MKSWEDEEDQMPFRWESSWNTLSSALGTVKFQLKAYGSHKANMGAKVMGIH